MISFSLMERVTYYLRHRNISYQINCMKGDNMKKLINGPEDVVKEALAGMLAAHSDLIRVDIEQCCLLRYDKETSL